MNYQAKKLTKHKKFVQRTFWFCRQELKLVFHKLFLFKIFMNGFLAALINRYRIIIPD